MLDHIEVAASSALWLSVTAIVIAGISLAVSIIGSLRLWPKLRVTRSISVHVTLGPDEAGIRSGAEYTFIVRVTNDRNQAETVDDVGWRVESPSWSRLSLKMLQEEGEEVGGDPLPCRVEGRDIKTWEVPGSIVFARLSPKGGDLFAWAQRSVPKHQHWPWPEERKLGIKTLTSERAPFPQSGVS